MDQPLSGLRIVHVEDNSDDALLVEVSLQKEGFSSTLIRVENEEDFVRALSAACPDLILSDFALPGFSGFAALDRARERCPDVPFIFVSGHIGEDRAIESLRRGATDYVLKDRLSRLGPVVRRALSEAAERKELRNLESSLATSRVETNLILEKALDAVVMMSAEGLVTGWNPQAERTFGWTRAEAVGRPLADLLIPSVYREEHRKGLDHFLRTGEGPILDRRIEFPAIHKEGFEIPLELSVIPIREAGRTFFAAFLRDVGDRKRAATRLAVEHAVTKALAHSPTLDVAIPNLLRAIAEGLSWNGAQFWKTDPRAQVLRTTYSWPAPGEQTSEFVQANRTFALRKGEGLPGKVWEKGEGVWIADLARADEFPRAALAHRAGIRGAFAFPVVDGQEILGVIECFHHDVRPPEPELLQMAEAIGREVGQYKRRKRAEEDLRALNEVLELRVEERTRRISQLAEELDSFSYTVAHDLRAPLRALKGFSDILMEGGESLPAPEAQAYLGHIQNAAVRMDALLQDLLAYSHLSRSEVSVVPVDLGWELEEVLLGMAAEIRERGAEVRVKTPLPAARAHRTTLRQVLVNLISNAMKFVAPGVAPRIRILAEERPERVRLWFEDNGIGIPADQHERIFKTFERLHSITEYPGTGIGLAIVKRGIERMGGACGVESTPGRGSRFWIELERPEAPAASRPE